MRTTPKSVIRTAVFPVAGRGTRFLPATKASPKEMLPVVDKPLIQYAVEEALAAGATRLVFITGAAKRAIEVGLEVNAGHDLSLENLGPFLKAVRGVAEVSIGHALIGDALEFGLATTVKKYLALCAG